MSKILSGIVETDLKKNPDVTVPGYGTMPLDMLKRHVQELSKDFNVLIQQGGFTNAAYKSEQFFNALLALAKALKQQGMNENKIYIELNNLTEGKLGKLGAGLVGASAGQILEPEQNVINNIPDPLVFGGAGAYVGKKIYDKYANAPTEPDRLVEPPPGPYKQPDPFKKEVPSITDKPRVRVNPSTGSFEPAKTKTKSSGVRDPKTGRFASKSPPIADTPQTLGQQIGKPGTEPDLRTWKAPKVSSASDDIASKINQLPLPKKIKAALGALGVVGGGAYGLYKGTDSARGKSEIEPTSIPVVTPPPKSKPSEPAGFIAPDTQAELDAAAAQTAPPPADDGLSPEERAEAEAALQQYRYGDIKEADAVATMPSGKSINTITKDLAKKALPVAGAVFYGPEIVDRAKKGDYVGAGIAGLGAAASFIPGSKAIGVGLVPDVINTMRDTGYQGFGPDEKSPIARGIKEVSKMSNKKMHSKKSQDSKMLENTLQSIADLNKINDVNKIFAGNQLMLPNQAVYVIKPGDTLSQIALDYNKGSLPVIDTTSDEFQDQLEKNIQTNIDKELAAGNKPLPSQKYPDSGSSPEEEFKDVRNNPGNLRFYKNLNKPGYVLDKAVGVDKNGFAIFATPEDGLNAMRRQIALDTQKRGLTGRQLINKYAPASDNNQPDVYINNVFGQLGIDPDSKIDPKDIRKIQQFMVRQEHGKEGMYHYYPELNPRNNMANLSEMEILQKFLDRNIQKGAEDLKNKEANKPKEIPKPNPNARYKAPGEPKSAAYDISEPPKAVDPLEIARAALPKDIEDAKKLKQQQKPVKEIKSSIMKGIISK